MFIITLLTYNIKELKHTILRQCQNGLIFCLLLKLHTYLFEWQFFFTCPFLNGTEQFDFDSIRLPVSPNWPMRQQNTSASVSAISWLPVATYTVNSSPVIKFMFVLLTHSWFKCIVQTNNKLPMLTNTYTYQTHFKLNEQNIF